MKKLFSCFAVICFALTASAQYQVTNNTFEGSWVKCYPWEKGAKVNSAFGETPTGWCVSNVPNTLMPVVAEEIDGVSGKAVKLSNVSVMGQVAPGYITLGTTWATAETRGTSVRNADGGSFGGVAFTHHPDAVQIKYKRDNSNGAERASLVAYLWKGSWSQENVPSNTAVGIFSYGTATKVTMTDRDRNILGIETILGGTVTPSDDAELIASVQSYITAATSTWTTLTAELEYASDSDPTMINIIVSATDYFADRSGITSGNSISLDDVILLYYSELASAKYDGSEVVFTNGAATVDASYDASKLTNLTSNGHGATIETSYNEESGVLTITVKGEDISENASNFHTYTIQFKTYEKGDVNKDGTVSIADVTALVNMILGKTEKNEMADVNADGDVSIADVTALVNIILGKN